MRAEGQRAEAVALLNTRARYRKHLGELVERVLREEVGRIFAEVPYAGHLTSDKEEHNELYYLRRRIETIRRIRMTIRTDGLSSP